MAILSNFDFILPTIIKFGYGRAQEAGAEAVNLGCKKAMIVTDKGIIAAGLLEGILKSLSEKKITVAIFDDVEPNPRDTTVQKGVEKAKAEGIDLLVAVGGGSSMDVAKAIGVVLTHGGVINDYEGLEAVIKPITPIIAIPTTVGTGSEVTFWSVITDTKRKFKMSVGSPLIAPRVALVDPLMVSKLPSKITASTGIDALTHAIEGYTCLLAEPLTDASALYAIELISENIRQAVFTECVESKANMLLASLIAGIAFGNSDIAGVHSMAEAVGGLYDTPHGIANAILLPYVMEYNYLADPKKHARIALAMGENIQGLTQMEAAFKSVDAVKKLNKDLSIPSLKEVGVLEKDLEELAQRSFSNVSSGSNCRIITKNDYLNIFKKSYIG
jgi:alcohol dehydrogenase